MKAAVFRAPYEIEVGDRSLPSVGPGEVLTRVAATGICAGDMYLYRGKNPYASYPLIGGHEIAGVVEKSDDAALRAGQLVVIEPFLHCGSCYPCSRGKGNCCTKLQIIGMHRDGGFAQFVSAPARNVHPVPEGLSARDASFAEPVAIGIQACRRGEIVEGDEVLVIGCGPIGLAILEVARARGARILATDRMQQRLDFAVQLGAIAIPLEELAATVKRRWSGDGAPVVFEATGSPAAMEQGAELVAAGGRLVIVGLVNRGVTITLPALDFTRKEMTILGSRASIDCFPEALALLAAGKITYCRAARDFSMWDAAEVFRQMDADASFAHKAVLLA